jgi:hypothetical protein
MHFSQAWLAEPEEGFRPGIARISWCRGELHLEVELIDDEVSTTATAHQQRLWEQGDVVELFLQCVGESGYHEYQIAPNSLTLALYYPDLSCVAAVRSGARRMEEFLTTLPTTAEALRTPQGWNARLSIPVHAVPGDRLRVSCSRYDAGTGRSPIISSTSPHPLRDFHRSQDWTDLLFSP